MGCEESMAARNSWGLRSPSSSRSSWGSRSPWSPMIGEGGGLTRIMPLPHWPIGCNESSKMRHIFGLFSTQFSPSHTLWDGRKEMKYSGKQPQSQYSYMYYQQILSEAYFSRFGQIADFRFSKCKGGPTNRANFHT